MRDVATTSGGALRLTLSKEDPVDNYNMTYRSGMASLLIVF